MRYRLLPGVIALFLISCTPADAPVFSWEHAGFERQAGFVDLLWDETEGRLILGIDNLDEPFIYQSSMARGIGSNDIGLDRGQLGAGRIAEFQRIGPRVLLMTHNSRYRAGSDNADEQLAVEESFARSVAWGFDVVGETGDRIFIDATEFFYRDAHNVALLLAELEEGEYQTDANRSAIYLPRTRAFPDNSEVEAIVTFVGKPTGELLETVVPDATSFTVHLHHSFIRLPDDDYEPLKFEPRAGMIGLSYFYDGITDYATPIGDPLVVGYARRHRLDKKDPAADVSEAVEPIVYYVDRGAPEPVRSALIEGASWWNQAYEAAGYKDAFQVELLPEDVDPMDVRYNVIQWVHRSTRGWSYGSSISDPRTGEILKGHVTLGSLRVRQDYLIAEGLLAPYESEAVPVDMLEMSLARIRQLSAHEVGHTLGIDHNFAASTQDRASVMDYPFPLIGFDDDSGIDLSDAYGTGIGAWDRRVVAFAYQDFAEDQDRDAERSKIMKATIDAGHKYVADEDSRDVGTAHPDGNLWDNGEDAIEQLHHLLKVRGYALEQFSENNIRVGRPLATLEEVLVPLYLLHRFQIRAVGKLIGGQYFNYAMRGDGQQATTNVAAARQRVAISALLGAMNPSMLKLPDAIVDAIPARPPGHAKSRESFPSSTGNTFDALGPASSVVSLTLDVLLHRARAARMIAAHGRDSGKPSFDELLTELMQASWYSVSLPGTEGDIQRMTNDLVLLRLLHLSADPEAGTQVKASAMRTVQELEDWLSVRLSRENAAAWHAHYEFARLQIDRVRHDPAGLELLVPVAVPPGSPIGGRN